MPMMPRGLCRLGLPVHAPPAADDQLDVLGGTRSADREQPVFGLGRRDPRQRPDFRVRQLTAGERLRQPRQRAERPRHADVLAGGARLEADAPGQPRRARAKAIAPAAAGVELADQIEQACGGGVEVGRQLGDLIAEALEFGSRTNNRSDNRRDAYIGVGVHRRISLRRVYVVFFEASGSHEEARSRAHLDFFEWRRSARVVASARAAEAPLSIVLRKDAWRARRTLSRVKIQIHVATRTGRPEPRATRAFVAPLGEA
jgi:hypothetical protein